MRAMLRRSIAAACVFGIGISPLLADPRAGRVDGRILAPDGSAAAQHEVLLLTGAGDLVASATTAGSGDYAFERVEPGAYRLGIREPEGGLIPVVGPPARVAAGERVRRDVRLSQSAGVRLAPAVQVPGSGGWWSRQTRNQKVFFVVGIVVGGVAALAAVNSALDDDEAPASPFE